MSVIKLYPKQADDLCPICGKPASADHLPFCSKACADIDLNRWFKGVYRTPLVENDEDEPSLPTNDNNKDNDKDSP